MITKLRQNFHDVDMLEEVNMVACSGDEAEWLDACARGQPDQAQAGPSQSSQSSMRSKELEGLSADSDILPVPVFVNAEGGSLSVTSAWLWMPSQPASLELLPYMSN